MKRIAALFLCIAALTCCDGFIQPDDIIMPDNNDNGTEKPEPKPEPEPEPEPIPEPAKQDGDGAPVTPPVEEPVQSPYRPAPAQIVRPVRNFAEIEECKRFPAYVTHKITLTTATKTHQVAGVVSEEPAESTDMPALF